MTKKPTSEQVVGIASGASAMRGFDVAGLADEIRIGNTLVNDDAMTGVQEGPSIAEIADGTRYVVTWVDHNGGHNHRYQVFEANGTAVCPEYAGRFRVRPSGAVQIIWTLGKGPPPSGDRPVAMAAQEAIDAAIRPRSGS